MTPAEQIAVEKEAALEELLEAVEELNNKDSDTMIGSSHWCTKTGKLLHKILGEKYRLIERSYLVVVMYKGEYIHHIIQRAYDENEALERALSMFNSVEWTGEEFTEITMDMLKVNQLEKSKE